MRLAILACCVGVALSLQLISADASPTPNEFKACHQLTSALLFDCLEQHLVQKNRQCMDFAQHKLDACYVDLRESYVLDNVKRDAAEKAKRESDASERAAS
jgi:peroxiredoxin